MNQRKLRVFYEVATRLNMTEVAEKMFISQPAVSQTIQELEILLSVKLFDRMGKKLYLTEEGKVFLVYARRILNLYDESIRVISEMNNFQGGKLKIGASTTIGIYVLPQIIGKFIKKYKGIDTSIAIENTQIISDMILKNEIDFAFVEGPISCDEIYVEDFCTDELVFICSAQHSLLENENLYIKDIAKEKLILREIGSGTRDIMEKELLGKTIIVNNSFQLGNTEAIKKAVEAGLGIGCMSKRCVEKEVEEGKLGLLKIKDMPIIRRFTLIYHKDKYISNLIKEFINFAKQEII